MQKPLILIFCSLLLSLAFSAAPARAADSGCAENYGWITKARAKVKLWRGRALVKLDAPSFKIFEKIRLEPAAQLTAEEAAVIESNGLGPTLAEYRNTNALVRKLNQRIAIQLRVQPMKKTHKHKPWPGFKKWGWDKAYFAGYWGRGMIPRVDWKKTERLILDYLLRAFLPVSRFGGPSKYAAHIYASALKDDFYGLSEFDRNFLKTWGFEQDYERFVAEAKDYRESFLKATKVQDTADGLKWTVMVTLPAAAAVAPILAPRVDKVEEVDQHLKDFKGVQLMYSGDPAVPTLLRTKTDAVLFEKPMAKYLKGEKLAEFDRMLAEKKVNYTRVLISANHDEVKKVMGKAKDFVTRNKTNDRGDLVYDSRVYFDSGLAESYKILESELGLPPAPIVKRYDYAMNTYFTLLKMKDGKNGRIKDFFQTRTAPESPSRETEASEVALRGYTDAMVYAFSPKLTVGGMLAADALPNTLWKNERVLKTIEKIEAEKLAKERAEQELREHGPKPAPPISR